MPLRSPKVAIDAVSCDRNSAIFPFLADNEEMARQMMVGVEEINVEDLAVNARTWKGLHSRFATMGPLSPHEEGVRRFRSWMSGELSRAERQPASFGEG